MLPFAQGRSCQKEGLRNTLEMLSNCQRCWYCSERRRQSERRIHHSPGKNWWGK